MGPAWEKTGVPVPGAARKGEDTMQEHGLKISELVTLFNLEVLNRGSDYDTALLTITDVNRPGLQFLRLL